MNINYLKELTIILFGTLDKFIIALIVIMVIDFITILLKTYYNKNISNINNDNIKKRLIKKLYILMLVILAHELDIIVGEDMNIRNISICFFIGTEGMNILNNAIAINISLPNILRRILQNIKNKSK